MTYITESPTFAAYACHLERKRQSVNTIKLRVMYAVKFNAYMDGRWSEASLEDIEDFLYTYAHRKAEPLAEATQATMVASMRGLFKWARRAGVIVFDPTVDLDAVRVHRRQARIASETQIREGLAGASLPVQAMILLGAECGLRVAEIANLQKSNREGEWLTLIGKGRVQRTVRLSPELQVILATIERTTMRAGNYFPGKHGRDPIHPSTAWRWISEAVHTNPHSLRHRAGTMVYRNGGKDIRMTQEFLGHSSPVTTSIYVHVGRDDLSQAAAAARIAGRGSHVVEAHRDRPHLELVSSIGETA